ncbi:MAG: hemolysin family protein [Hyphomicrobiales bacterium]|nr:hemolysin family protein [Hyphomicrobiales bacterium]
MSEAVASQPQTRNAETDETAPQEEPGLLTRLLGRIGLAGDTDIRDVIEDALENVDASEESFLPQERAMLHNLLRFGAVVVEDVMVPRADIVSVDEQATLGELMCTFEAAGHSRVPVYHETLDDPRGMVHIKDLMAWIAGQSRRSRPAKTGKKPAARLTKQKQAEAAADAPSPVSQRLSGIDLSLSVAAAGIGREMLFVPPSMSALELLLRMQATRIHLALVVDEYGGTDGLVSIEDLVEEIVGEIEDEHDQNGGPLIREVPGEGLIAAARAPIAELEERLGAPLVSPERDEDVDTLGGLVFTLAGRVPVRGELVRHESGLEFEVLDADPRRIKKLRIHLGSDKDAARSKTAKPASDRAES